MIDPLMRLWERASFVSMGVKERQDILHGIFAHDCSLSDTTDSPKNGQKAKGGIGYKATNSRGSFLFYFRGRRG